MRSLCVLFVLSCLLYAAPVSAQTTSTVVGDKFKLSAEAMGSVQVPLSTTHGIRFFLDDVLVSEVQAKDFTGTPAVVATTPVFFTATKGEHRLRASSYGPSGTNIPGSTFTFTVADAPPPVSQEPLPPGNYRVLVLDEKDNTLKMIPLTVPQP